VRAHVKNLCDYYWIEVVDDSNQLLIRVGFDHEPTQEELDALVQQLLAPPEPPSSPPEEVSPLWRP
jgi:hypothetical protein